jgi:hypothetical protein
MKVNSIINKVQTVEECLHIEFRGMVDQPCGSQEVFEDEPEFYTDRWEDIKYCSYSDNGSFSGDVYYKIEGKWHKFYVAS